MTKQKEFIYRYKKTMTSGANVKYYCNSIEIDNKYIYLKFRLKKKKLEIKEISNKKQL